MIGKKIINVGDFLMIRENLKGFCLNAEGTFAARLKRF